MYVYTYVYIDTYRYIYMHIHLCTCVLRDVAANVAVQPLIDRIALANSVSAAPSLVVALG